MKIDVLSRAKKKKFTEGLSNLGIKKIPQMLVRSGKERIRAFSGSLDREQIMDIWRILPIEGVGLYVGKDMVNRNGVREVRLSLDGMHVWKEQLTRRILYLTEEQEVNWFLGKDIELDEKQKMEEGFVSVKSGIDFVGIGKIGADGDKLFSFLPKERRRKERMS
jgi:NOL1/NOP2/fmu family ribosome biogenesis protein